jgi:hypothetical protein
MKIFKLFFLVFFDFKYTRFIYRKLRFLNYPIPFPNEMASYSDNLHNL